MRNKKRFRKVVEWDGEKYYSVLILWVILVLVISLVILYDIIFRYIYITFLWGFYVLFMFKNVKKPKKKVHYEEI